MNLIEKSKNYLNTLCNEIENRSVGSKGNLEATNFFKGEIEKFSWLTEIQKFEAMDWETEGVELTCDNNIFSASASPYSTGCNETGQLVCINEIEAFKETDTKDKIVLLYGNIAKEQLMPKNFMFYNPDEHKEIVAALENSGAKTIITATGRNSALAGGMYPFPMIEDGDFNIPSIYMTEEEGLKLKKLDGKFITVNSNAKRIQSVGYNVIGTKGINEDKRIVITAHIDAKKNSPGAIDNATGVIILLLLAELLKDYNSDTMLELVAFNGEDYYAVPGQMAYISEKQNQFNTILCNINIDGAGYFDGPSSISFYELPNHLERKIKIFIQDSDELFEGNQWVQGDHSIFVQHKVPAIAITSEWFLNNMETQTVTHTPKDNARIVDCEKLVNVACCLKKIIEYVQ